MGGLNYELASSVSRFGGYCGTRWARQALTISSPTNGTPGISVLTSPARCLPPVLPATTARSQGGTGVSIGAPSDINGNLSATITLPNGGYLTVTDVEVSGDQFQMLVNGLPATLAPPNPLLSPAGQDLR